MVSLIEDKAKPKQKKSFDARQAMLDVFRAELAILMKDEDNRTIRPFEIPPGYDERYFIDRVVQDREYIETVMMQRLKLSRWRIREFLQEVTEQVKAGMVNAPDYAPRQSKTKKKAGRKVKPRQGKPKQVGQYKSIKEASLHDKERSYAALRQKLWRESQRENSL